ncbi:hypothetical protein AB0903_11030 [Streptomyces sp. NPDC048389]|uniref:DUF7848 domain-containing protein n=1 Tax=Streptomyces sp. NPDC048389 TaxID=3154622 RepID=UPI00345255BB
MTLDDDDKECGAESGPSTDPDTAKRWAWDHWKGDRGHSRFSEVITRPWSTRMDGPS